MRDDEVGAMREVHWFLDPVTNKIVGVGENGRIPGHPAHLYPRIPVVTLFRDSTLSVRPTSRRFERHCGLAQGWYGGWFKVFPRRAISLQDVKLKNLDDGKRWLREQWKKIRG